MPLFPLVHLAATFLVAVVVASPTVTKAAPDEPASTVRAQPLQGEDDTGVDAARASLSAGGSNGGEPARSGQCAGRGAVIRREVIVAAFAASPLVAGGGIWATERATDALEAGLTGFYTVGLTTALAAASSLAYMECRPGHVPRRWLWAAGFLPVVAGLAVQHAHAYESPYEEHPWIAIGSGLAATVLWFGVSAFTPLGYADADAPAARASSEDAAAVTPPLVPYVAAVRAGREWKPALGLSMRF